MPHEPRALILDFGGVISRTLFETHDLSEQALGLPPGSLTWRGPFAPETDDLWRSMQADEMTEREYWRRRTVEVADLAGCDWTEMADFVRAVRGDSPADVIRPEFMSAVAKARNDGVKLAILSNELDLFYGAGFRQKLAFLDDFDVIHDATYTKTLKPDASAYTACLDALGVAAEAGVFVDDQLRNIKGAQAVGLKTVHFDVQAPRDGYAMALRLLGLEPESLS